MSDLLILQIEYHSLKDISNMYIVLAYQTNRGLMIRTYLLREYCATALHDSEHLKTFLCLEVIQYALFMNEMLSTCERPLRTVITVSPVLLISNQTNYFWDTFIRKISSLGNEDKKVSG